MTALADDRSLDQQEFGTPSIVQGGVDGGTKLYMGAFAAPLSATGYLAVGGGVASTNAVMGIASHRADNTDGSDGDISVNLANGVFARPNSSGAALTQAHFGKPCYAEDTQTVRNATGATYPLAGVCLGLNDEGEVLVWVSAVMNYLLSQGALETLLASVTNTQGAYMIGAEDAAGRYAAAQLEAITTDLGARIALAFADTAAQTAYSATARADLQIAVVENDDAGAHADFSLWLFDAGSAAGATDWVRVPDAGSGRWLRLLPTLAELASTANGYGAALLGVEDASSYWTGTDGEAVLDEIGANFTTAQGIIPVPLTSFVDPDGDPTVKYAGAPVPGHTLADSEGMCIKWGTHANPDLIWSQIDIPPDLDESADLVIHFLMSKSGATLGDAVTMDVTGFFQTVGALHDADVDVGGTSDALTGDAVAKTVDELILAIASANVPAAPASLSFSIQVTDGTLGTDDAYLFACWFEYTKKILTA